MAVIGWLLQVDVQLSEVLPPVVRHGAGLWRGYRLQRHGRREITTCSNTTNTFLVAATTETSCEDLWFGWPLTSSSCNSALIAWYVAEHVGRGGGWRGMHSCHKQQEAVINTWQWRATRELKIINLIVFVSWFTRSLSYSYSYSFGGLVQLLNVVA